MWSQFWLFLLSPLLKWVTVTGIIGVGGLLIFFLSPNFVSDRVRVLCGMVGAGALCGGIFYWYAFHAGERHMAQRIAAKDKAAIQRVDEGRKEVEACNGGIDWDDTVGACVPGRFQ